MPGWSSPIAVEQNLGIDVLPTALQASNGTMWLAWQTNRYRGDSFYDIAIKTGSLGTNGVSWSSPVRLTMNSGYNSGPALTQLANGTIMLFWSYKTGSSYNIYYSAYNSASWSSGFQVTSTTLNDTLASATVGHDGTLWLVWTRVNATCQICSPDQQLYYKTLKGNVWSSEVKLTSDSNQNYGSSVIVGKDSTIRVVWSKGLSSQNNYQVYYKTFDGTVWSSETRVVTSSTADLHPSLAQDRNGTLWIVWARDVVLSPTTFYYVMFSKNSVNNGASWSAETQMTNTATTVDSKMPVIVQSSNDKSLWIFYITDPGPNEDIWALRSSAIAPVHDVSLLSFSPIYSPSNVLQYSGGFKTIGQSPFLTLNVTIGDPGDFTEIVQVTLTIFNSTNYVVRPMAAVASPGGMTNLLFKWNTTGVRPALYGFIAAVSPIPGESLGNSGDDSLSGRNVFRILPIGDVDQDGWVSVVDAGIFFYNFNFGCGTPSRYNALADPDNDCMIGIIDVGMVEINFGIVS
jgi:hypothetical protein